MRFDDSVPRLAEARRLRREAVVERERVVVGVCWFALCIYEVECSLGAQPLLGTSPSKPLQALSLSSFALKRRDVRLLAHLAIRAQRLDNHLLRDVLHDATQHARAFDRVAAHDLRKLRSETINRHGAQIRARVALLQH